MTSNTEAKHLLVYYTDPEYRQWLKDHYADRIKAYTGEKIGYKEDWYDLGYVRGEAGGLHIIKNVEQESDLYDAVSGKAIKPEEIIPDPDHAGWAMTVGDPTAANPTYQIYVFDYAADKWYSIGTIDSTAIAPEYVIAAADIDNEPTALRPKGFWLVTETIKYAL